VQNVQRFHEVFRDMTPLFWSMGASNFGASYYFHFQGIFLKFDAAGFSAMPIPTKQHGVICRKTAMFIVTAV
jgi:hypothetical protein